MDERKEVQKRASSVFGLPPVPRCRDGECLRSLTLVKDYVRLEQGFAQNQERLKPDVTKQVKQEPLLTLSDIIPPPSHVHAMANASIVEDVIKRRRP